MSSLHHCCLQETEEVLKKELSHHGDESVDSIMPVSAVGQRLVTASYIFGCGTHPRLYNPKFYCQFSIKVPVLVQQPQHKSKHWVQG